VVLLVDDLPLRAEEVAPLSDAIRELYPEYSSLHARRLALTNDWLPRLACRARYADAWEAAREACERAAEPTPDQILVREGTFDSLGLGLWSEARRLPVGVWSPPLETPGRWVRVRLEDRQASKEAREETLRVALVAFPYVDPGHLQEAIDTAVDSARLTLIEPDFAEAVPEAWKHRMHASLP